jgi:hypothetical protein
MFVMMSYSFSLCDNNKFKFINKFVSNVHVHALSPGIQYSTVSNEIIIS